MDSVVVDGVPFVVFPAGFAHGRWCVQFAGRDFGAMSVIVHEIIKGQHPGWVEGILARETLRHGYSFARFSRGDDLGEWELLHWSSFGGSEGSNDYYILGLAEGGGTPHMLIPSNALIALLSLLLERSRLDPTRTPPPLGTFDPNADYAKLPYPPSPPEPPPPPLKDNVRLLQDLSGRLWDLAQLERKDRAAAHKDRVTILNEMKELGIFREDLIGSHDAGIANADHLSRFLSKIDELRKYYASAHRKSALGTTSIPNVLGGPLSYQLIDQTRSWDFGDHHPHEIFAQLESLMRKQSNLEGDFGERKVEDGTFKATFHWEREDGIHASLTKVIVESW